MIKHYLSGCLFLLFSIGVGPYTGLMSVVVFLCLLFEQSGSGPDWRTILGWASGIIATLVTVLGGIFYKKISDIEQEAKESAEKFEKALQERTGKIEKALQERTGRIDEDLREHSDKMESKLKERADKLEEEIKNRSLQIEESTKERSKLLKMEISEVATALTLQLTADRKIRGQQHENNLLALFLIMQAMKTGDLTKLNPEILFRNKQLEE